MPQSARHIRVKSAVALLLTFVAGCVDILGYLTLFHIFTANMTGNTVHLGDRLLVADWAGAARAGCVIAAFLAGSVVGRTIIEIGSRTRVRTIASAALLLEAALIAAVIPLAARGFDEPQALGLLALLAAAMGMQTATLTRIGPLTVHTTFVTGMLNKLAQLISRGLFLTYDVARGGDERAARREVWVHAGFMFSIWLLYLSGAITGTLMKSAWGARSLLAPIAILVVVIVLDHSVPLSIEEEHDQPER